MDQVNSYSPVLDTTGLPYDEYDEYNGTTQYDQYAGTTEYDQYAGMTQYQNVNARGRIRSSLEEMGATFPDIATPITQAFQNLFKGTSRSASVPGNIRYQAEQVGSVFPDIATPIRQRFQ